MPTIRERITSTGESRWQVQIRLPGHRPVSRTFRTKTAAKAWASRTENAMRDGDVGQVEARRHTFGQLVQRYLETALPRLKSVDDRRARKRQLEWWQSRLGKKMTLDRLTPAVIAEGRDRLERKGGKSGDPASPATVNRYLAALSHACSLAVKEWLWLQSNPCRRVRRRRETLAAVRVLDKTETKALLDAARRHSDRRMYPLIVMALSTGARAGELMALRWSDVDRERRRVLFRDTKSREHRSAKLVDQCAEALAELATLRSIADEPVFCALDGRTAFPRHQWEQVREAAKLTDLRFHDLRHTAASHMAMSGSSMAEVAAVLGHKTLAMVKRYQHWFDEHLAEAQQRAADKFLG